MKSITERIKEQIENHLDRLATRVLLAEAKNIEGDRYILYLRLPLDDDGEIIKLEFVTWFRDRENGSPVSGCYFTVWKEDIHDPMKVDYAYQKALKNLRERTTRLGYSDFASLDVTSAGEAVHQLIADEVLEEREDYAKW